MRYGILSDIHGNLEAFRAVNAALAKEGIDEYLFAGDLIGYGADPHACIAALQLLKAKALVAGNHEWGALGQLGLEYFNEYAAAAIEWTRRELSVSDLEYIRTFRLTYAAGDLMMVHGSPAGPSSFGYIFEEADARLAFKEEKARVCFVGHTHTAGIFYSDGDRVAFTARPDLRMTDGKRYIVNVGSVGQPRDGDPRAAYGVYDTEAGTIAIRRVVYDIASAQEKIIKAGLPPFLADRLAEGR